MNSAGFGYTGRADENSGTPIVAAANTINGITE
jgi:hypothetical protein